jgi:alpha-D-ribose 1-methylphosphonate 5-triphosphate synthase subunit PhnH
MTIHAPCERTQPIYRALLQAMSRPGVLVRAECSGWPSLALAVAETLLDHETSYAILSETPLEELDRAIFETTKARRAPLEEADYIVVPGWESNGRLVGASRGTPEFPDRGATLLYLVREPCPEADAQRIRLSGPGIDGEIHPETGALAPSEWELLRGMNDEYPLGVDAIVLLGPDRILCIPRSTRIELS